MSNTNINCDENNFLSGMSGRYGWWINYLSPLNSPNCSGSIGTDAKGTTFEASCPNKISGVKYNKGTGNIGSIQLICDNGEETNKYGAALGQGEGALETFMCPTGTYLSNVSSNLYGGYVGSLDFTPICKSETFATPNNTNNSIVTPAANLTNAVNETNSGYTMYILFFVIIIVTVAVIGFVVYKKMKA